LFYSCWGMSYGVWW